DHYFLYFANWASTSLAVFFTVSATGAPLAMSANILAVIVLYSLNPAVAGRDWPHLRSVSMLSARTGSFDASYWPASDLRTGGRNVSWSCLSDSSLLAAKRTNALVALACLVLAA